MAEQGPSAQHSQARANWGADRSPDCAAQEGWGSSIQDWGQGMRVSTRITPPERPATVFLRLSSVSLRKARPHLIKEIILVDDYSNDRK